MPSLEPWNQKIFMISRNTSFRDFVRSICSWMPANLYRNHGMISAFPQSDRTGKLIPAEHYSKNPDLYIELGREYDTSVSFFKNFSSFFQDTPRVAIRQLPPVKNSEYAEIAGWGIRDCYLSFAVVMESSYILYSFEVKENCHDIYNSVMVWDNSSQVYQSNCILKSQKIFYSRYIYNSSDIYWSSNLIGCHECIFCSNLENASYSIKNKVYTREEYTEKKEEILRNPLVFERYYSEVATTWANLVSTNTTWSYATNCKNVVNGYYSTNTVNAKNILLFWSQWWNKNVLNVAMSGSPEFSDIANVINSGGWSSVFCSDFVANVTAVYYSSFLEDCSFCIGCIWLKNKSYCILNKQYTKEEWEVLAEKIFASMEADGTLGEFFPASMNPFYFNDTLAYLIDDSFTKEEVEKEWYLWRDEPIRADIPEGMEVVKNTELEKYQWFGSIRHSRAGGNLDSVTSTEWQEHETTETEWYIDPEVMKKVIIDEKGNYYRIVKMEYDFLMKHALPLPTLHWLDRMKMGFQI